MPFVKLVKNKAYFKRFQVKYRRRREGKTDYRARKRMVAMDKNKYQAHRYRFVVRFTNTKVITQVIYSEISGDRVLTSATSDELKRYGLEVGLSNYAAGYCTGLLCARRLLKQLGLDEMYEGNTEVDGTVKTCEQERESNPRQSKVYYVAELDDERRPFRAVLDVGIRNTTTGARVFGVMKGAVDGGLDIPHTEKRFVGYDREAKEYDADAHRERIFGAHVADYMRTMQEEDSEKYSKHFSAYVSRGIDADALEALYESVHDKIRADPARPEKKDKAIDKDLARRFKNPVRRNLAQRKDRVKQRKESRIRQLQAIAAAEED
jgi:large subunit ribosomal protein L5e